MPARRLPPASKASGETAPGKSAAVNVSKVEAVPPYRSNDKWRSEPLLPAPPVPQKVLPAPNARPAPNAPAGTSVLNVVAVKVVIAESAGLSIATSVPWEAMRTWVLVPAPRTASVSPHRQLLALVSPLLGSPAYTSVRGLASSTQR